MAENPISVFETWFKDARDAGSQLPEAMTLATATRSGIPFARIVLLKDVSRGGFVFYTHYESPKSQELKKNPRAALIFHWEKLQRQVRIEGKVTRVTKAESDAYFATRERGSQIGAWASQQSEVLKDRADLENRVRELEKKYEGRDVPRPPNWGGFRVAPEKIEFWQGRAHRLHERTLYSRRGGKWRSAQLSP